MPVFTRSNAAAPQPALPPMDELLSSESLVPHFQAIVNLGGRPGVHGYEALARFGDGRLGIEPASLFEYARLCGRVGDLELACMGRTFRQMHLLDPCAKLFVNLHPAALLGGEEFAADVIEMADAHGVDCSRLVIEITEQDHFPLCDAAFRAIGMLRACGAFFALDDVGVSYSHLDRLVWIQPQYLKISAHFGTGFEGDATRRKIVRNIVALAHDFECAIVLEGVETAATSLAAARLGAAFAQGFFYARPAPIRIVCE
ncbi:MAG TPA: EAL domain-containing protein [Thermoanaerobaculia bacterium]|nr:EAL domain-containing protein [Thermoanaerobaculia bacterium]